MLPAGPFCHRALLALEEKQTKYSQDYVDFADKPEWYARRKLVYPSYRPARARGRVLLLCAGYYSRVYAETPEQGSFCLIVGCWTSTLKAASLS